MISEGAVGFDTTSVRKFDSQRRGKYRVGLDGTLVRWLLSVFGRLEKVS